MSITSVNAQKAIVLEAPTYVNVFAGETNTINLTITNNRSVTDRFSIFIYPEFLSYSPGEVIVSSENSTVELAGVSSSTIRISFSASFEALGTQGTSITVASKTDPNITETKNIFVSVLKKPPVYISNFMLNSHVFDPGQSFLLKIELTNRLSRASGSYVLETIISKDTFSKTFENPVSNMPAFSAQNISVEYDLSKNLPPGDYHVSSILKDDQNNAIDNRTADFTVNAVYMLPDGYTEKTRSVGILSSTVTLTVKNEGNSPSPPFNVTESIPVFAQNFFSPETTPTFITRTGNSIVYIWSFSSLAPGDEVVVKYQFILWYVWIIILVLIVAVFIFLKLTLTPQIIKKYRHGSDNEIMVSLDVRNRGLSEIRNVMIKDLVPSVTQLSEKFETLKPKGRKIARGIELMWSFDLLRPREERVVTYRVMPKVGIIGTLNLPSATMTYADRKNEKKTVNSGILVVRSK